jgi:positive regulator of sigma E activity
MGRTLHSTNACIINIVNHIGQQMRKQMCKEIIRSNSKISLIIHESTMLSKNLL